MPLKSLIITIVLGIAAFGLWSLGGFAGLGWCSLSPPVQAADTRTSVFRVEGMTCGGCAVGLKAAVRKLPGVQKVEASYEEGKAVVTHDPSKVKPEQIKAAIEKLGYKAALQKNGGEKK